MLLAFSPHVRLGGFRTRRRNILLALCAAGLLSLSSSFAFAVSSWNPTFLVNTEAFQSIDDSNASADIELRFGSDLNTRLYFDRGVDRFNFTKSVYIQGHLTVTGSLALTSVTTSGGVMYASGSQMRVTPTGSSGQILQSQGTATPLWRTPTGGMIWYLDGEQLVGASQGAQVTMPFSITLSGVTMNIKGAPTGAALIADVKSDGASIFSTKPQINAGETTGGSDASFSVSSIPINAIVTLDIDQVGSTFAGSGLTVIVRGIRQY